MLGWLKARLGGASAQAKEAAPEPAPATTVDVSAHLLEGAWALVDWHKLAADHADTRAAHGEAAFFTAATRSWMQHAATTFGEGYRVDEGPDYLLLCPYGAADAQPLLRIAQQQHARVAKVLGAQAQAPAPGKLPIVLLADLEAYYAYVAQYYPEGGEYGFSGGMFIDAGRPHIVSVVDRVDVFERVIAHELTHLALRHLHLPVWLDEGIAVNTEERLCGAVPSIYTLQEMRAKHLRYWNAERIQLLWSGDIFHASDEGQLLGYDLAKTVAMLMARQDFDAFTRFAEQAERADAGASAAQAQLGIPLEHFVAAILGDGDWSMRAGDAQAPMAARARGQCARTDGGRNTRPTTVRAYR